jgi:hypothetical protein
MENEIGMGERKMREGTQLPYNALFDFRLNEALRD